MNNLIEIVILVILLAVATVTAASEIALIAVSRLRLRKLSSDGSKTAKLILKILEMPAKFFGTILVSNNIVDTLIAVIVTAGMIRLAGEGRWVIVLATIIAAGLIIISEVTAKTLAARNPEKISWMLARPIRGLMIIFAPIVRVFELFTEFIIHLFVGKTEVKASLVTEEEIRALIKIGEEEGVLHKEKFRMLSRVFDFGKTIVRSVMTPRDNIFSVSIDSRIDDILDKAVESGYSRIPVYKDKPENIVGIINMKDLLNLSVNKNLVVLHDMVYPPAFVPDTKKVTELLREFQKGHTHLAVVLNAAGKIEGLVTLEDLLEEIVGEIQDESDIRGI